MGLLPESGIKVFATGGTFDKEYDEINGRLFFKDSHVREMLSLARCRLTLELETLMMVDSLDLSEADRELIVERCRRVSEKRIVITHGTDTMELTARTLERAALAK